MSTDVIPAVRHKVFSVPRVSAIASNTLLELVRLKVFYFLLIFALLIIGSSAFMLDFGIQEQMQVLKDMSLGAMSIFTWLLAVFATAMLLPNDIEDRTLYTILAKPVPRFEYLLGKLFGVFWLLLISVIVMSVMFAIALFIKEQSMIKEAMRGAATPSEQAREAIAAIKASTFSTSLALAVIAIYLKAALCASFTLLISTFASSTIFTMIVSFVVYFIGHVQGVARDALRASATSSTVMQIFVWIVALLFPDLQLFNLVDDIVAGNAIPLGIFMKTACLGVAYTSVYTLVAYLIFASKEL